MNKRNFIKSLATVGAGFMILPSSLTYDRVWRTERLLFPSFIQVLDRSRGSIGSSGHNLRELIYSEKIKLVKKLNLFDFVKDHQIYYRSRESNLPGLRTYNYIIHNQNKKNYSL